MRVAVVAMVVGVVAGLIARGRPSNLLSLPVRRTWLLGVFLVATFLAHQGVPGAFGLLLLGMAAFAAFAFVNALPVRGLLLVGVGLTINLIVTADNHGMPYRPSAVVSAGAVHSTSADLVPSHSIASHPEDESDQLMMLADVIPLRPLHEVVSLGDILVAIGLGLVVFHGVLGDGQRKPRHLAARAAVAAGDPPHDVVAADVAAQAPIDAAITAEAAASPWSPPVRSNASPGEPGGPATPVDPAVGDPDDAAWRERVRLLKATGDISVIVDLTHDAAGHPGDQPTDVADLVDHVARRVRNDGELAGTSPAAMSAQVAVLRALRAASPSAPATIDVTGASPSSAPSAGPTVELP